MITKVTIRIGFVDVDICQDDVGRFGISGEVITKEQRGLSDRDDVIQAARAIGVAAQKNGCSFEDGKGILVKEALAVLGRTIDAEIARHKDGCECEKCIHDKTYMMGECPVTIGGQKKTLKEWCEVRGMTLYDAYKKIKLGATAGQALGEEGEEHLPIPRDAAAQKILAKRKKADEPVTVG